MILQEDYRNLNMIDRSIVRYIQLNKPDLNLSIDSEVLIDKVYDINNEGKKVNHTFTKVIDILDQDDVAAIVFRASRKQLCLIGKEDLHKALLNNAYGDYVVIFSLFGFDIINQVNSSYNQRILSVNETKLRYIIENLFKSAYDKEYVGNKVWDILVIKKDNKEELRQQRKKSQKGMIYSPSIKNAKLNDAYKAQTDIMIYQLSERLKKYKDKKMNNFNFPQDVMNIFINDKKMNRIKYKDRIYVLKNRETSDGGRLLKLNYEYDYQTYGDGNVPPDERILSIEIKYDGIYPTVDKVYLNEYAWYDYSRSHYKIYNKED